MNLLAKLGACVLIGACIMVGVRAVEWTIDKPETRIIICVPSDSGDLQICRDAYKLLNSKVRMV